MPQSLPVGVILAGGQSRRMGGAPKALLELAGKPLLAHVIQRLQGQCSRLILSVEIEDPAWHSFGLQQLADINPGSRGPLGGVWSALQSLQENESQLLLAPCDAPFLPLNLAQELGAAADRAKSAAALVCYLGQWQPTFSLWHASLLPALQAGVTMQGMRGLQEFLRTLPPTVVDWPKQERSPFFNINTPEDLACARHLLDPQSGPIS